MSELYPPTLHRFPDDAAGRFATLREFLRRWHGIDTGAVGRTVARVDEAEARVKRSLPPAVREWIVLLDDLARSGRWSDVLRDGWGLKKVPGCAAFSLLIQGENDRIWGPKLRDLAQEDPPTHVFVGGPDRFEHVRQIAPRVSTWALEFIVTYLYLSPSVQIERMSSRAAFDALRERRPEGGFASTIGATELFEFAGGLIHAEPEGESYRLRCYAPYHGASDRYYSTQGEFAQRLTAMLAGGP